jgi:hypothetical protein
MSDVNVYSLEKQEIGFKQAMELRDSAEKLARNPDFKKLILKHFMVEECSLYAQRSADPALNQTQRDDAMAIAQSAGHLKRFLNVIVQMGNHAEGQMPALQAELVEARNEADAEEASRATGAATPDLE